MTDFLKADKEAAAAQNKKWSESKPTDHLKNENPPEDDGGEDAPQGLLSKGADPVGKGLGTVLSPVGAVVGTITKPVGDTVGGITKPALSPLMGTKDERAEVLGGDNRDSYVHGKDSLGGQVQSADNPLGLEQTGKWGFREEH